MGGGTNKEIAASLAFGTNGEEPPLAVIGSSESETAAVGDIRLSASSWRGPAVDVAPKGGTKYVPPAFSPEQVRKY
jgi:hypothetical protein